jgi:hypothetical protein
MSVKKLLGSKNTRVREPGSTNALQLGVVASLTRISEVLPSGHFNKTGKPRWHNLHQTSDLQLPPEYFAL